MGAEFILDKQVLSTPDAGLLLALEQPGDGMDTFPSSSAMLESLDGLLELSALTKNATYADRALDTARWVRDNAYIDEPAALAASNTSGLLWDLYNVTSRSYVHNFTGTRPTAY